MKSKFIGSLALLLIAGSSFANCLPKYQDEYAKAEDGSRNGDCSGACGLFLPALPFLTTSAIEDGNQADKLEKVINVINDADAGNGLALQQFVTDSGLDTAKAAEFVRQADESGVLCSEQDLLTYDDIVSLAKK